METDNRAYGDGTTGTGRYGPGDYDTNPTMKKSGKARVFWGIAFILAAAAVVLHAMGFITLGGLSVGWLVLSILMVVFLVLSILHGFWFGIFFPIAALIAILGEPLHLVTAQIDNWIWFGAALLLSIGFTILFRKRKRHRFAPWFCNDGVHVYGIGPGATNRHPDSVDDSVVRIEVNFGEVIKYIKSDSLERVEAECNFGSIKLYFDDATPSERGALVVLDVNFGNAELFIPRTWRVNDNLKRSMSGIEERNHPYGEVERTGSVTITGEANFSGIYVTYV
jgi:hypothetical protein